MTYIVCGETAHCVQGLWGVLGLLGFGRFLVGFEISRALGKECRFKGEGVMGL